MMAGKRNGLAMLMMAILYCVMVVRADHDSSSSNVIQSNVSKVYLCEKQPFNQLSTNLWRQGTIIPLQYSSKILFVPNTDVELNQCNEMVFDPTWLTYLTRLEQPRHSRQISTFAARNDMKVVVLDGTKSMPYVIVSVRPDSVRDFDFTTQTFHKELLRRAPKPNLKKPSRLSLAQTSSAHRKDEKDDILASLDKEEYYDTMLYLTGEESFELDGKSYLTVTRYTHSEQNKYAAAYILDWFNQFGFDDAFYQEFTYGGTTTQNIIAVKTGTTNANEIVVVGAHMDSTSQSPSTLAPGCVDNGSGTDGVMLIAKAFANVTTSRTIHFIAFGCEEQGLIGSEYYVDQLDRNGYNVVSALTMDMIGYSGNYYGVNIEGTTDPDIIELMNILDDNVKEYSPKLNSNLRYYSYGSDHVSFQRAGIPALLAIEEDDVDYPGYHRTTDAINYLNEDQAIDIVRAIAGALYDLTV